MLKFSPNNDRINDGTMALLTDWPTRQHTISLQNSSSWEANVPYLQKQIHCFLCNTEIYCRIQKTPTLSRTNAFDTFHHNF
jgi:hypothetical protein